jgi:hypothetical protein
MLLLLILFLRNFPGELREKGKNFSETTER